LDSQYKIYCSTYIDSNKTTSVPPTTAMSSRNADQSGTATKYPMSVQGNAKPSSMSFSKQSESVTTDLKGPAQATRSYVYVNNGIFNFPFDG